MVKWSCHCEVNKRAERGHLTRFQNVWPANEREIIGQPIRCQDKDEFQTAVLYIIVDTIYYYLHDKLTCLLAYF
jgi:hypothetical protein